jgi:hypothetical protein
MLNTNNPTLKDLETLKTLDSFRGFKINPITRAWEHLFEMFNETDKGKLFWEVQGLTKDIARRLERLNQDQLDSFGQSCS